MKSFFLTRFLRCQILPRKLICRSVTSGPSPPYLEFSSQCDDSTRQKLIKDFQVHVDFISEAEESRLMEELTPKLKRMRYQYDHWDDVRNSRSILIFRLNLFIPLTGDSWIQRDGKAVLEWGKHNYLGSSEKFRIHPWFLNPQTRPRTGSGRRWSHQTPRGQC